MALCPFATHKLIAPGSNDPRIQPRVAILHVDAGGAESLFSFFRYRSGGIESHFHIRWTGVIEQYRDTDWEADANHHANDFAVSIETQGFGGGKWNRRQLASIKRLLLWLNETHDIPLQRCPQWDGAGIGYHVQFGAPGPWTPVAKSCPGPRRIEQFHDWFVPWLNQTPSAEEAPVSIRPRDIFRYRLWGKRGGNRTLADAIRQISTDVKAIRSDVEEIKRSADPNR